jgi:hypothetical protein
MRYSYQTARLPQTSFQLHRAAGIGGGYYRCTGVRQMTEFAI